MALETVRRRGVPERVFDRMVQVRRAIHRHPELAWQEHRTAELISDQLTSLGLDPYRVCETGLVVDLGPERPGPRIALRADLDALPIHEETGLEFASEQAGAMHACGHDGHSSMLLGAAALLLDEPASTPVRLIWQPAEETGLGSRAMIKAGVLDGVDMIFGGHVDRHFLPGELVVTEGPVNASTDRFSITISGQEGHGARPHETVDAIVVGSLLVTAIQTIVSREVDPAHPSVVSVGSFQAGTAPNVIAGRARLSGTIRAQHSGVRKHLREAVARIATAVGQLHGARVEVEVDEGTPPLLNEPFPTALAREAAERVVDAERVTTLRTANMGGEDFAFYLERVPGAYIRFGSQVSGREGFPAHSSRFDFDESALATGAAWLAEIARVAGRRLADDESRDQPS